MQILHFSDTHLGFAEREDDFYDSFHSIINEALRLKPDYIIHSGDFFDRARPNNRAITIAFNELKRISNAKIPMIIIAGNHSIPKEEGKVSILEAFNSLDYITSITIEYQNKEFKDVVFHMIPHINSIELRTKAIKNLKSNMIQGKKNILILHCSIQKNYLMEESGEWIYPKEDFEDLALFDYVALGHWHKMKKIKENIYYSGSSERTSLSDKDKIKHFLMVDLTEKIEVTSHKIEIKEHIEIEIDESIEESIEAILNKLKNRLEDNQNSIITLKLQNLSESLNQILPYELFERFGESLKIQKSFKLDDKNLDVNFDSIESMFLEHLSDKNLDRLKSKAQKIFSIYETKNDN